jgi:hypothetical protein
MSILARAVRFVCAAATLAAGAAGCGDSPTSPSLNIAGNWTGTWQFRSAGVTVTEDVTATFTQSGSNASGNWSAQSGATGQFTIAVGESITGTMTISQTLFTGQVCSGSTTLTGTAAASAVDLTIAPLTSSGLCQWATEIRFLLQR